MKLTIVVIILNLVYELQATDPYILTNDQYPKPYYGPLTRKRFNYTVPDGYGTIILFRQFLMSSNDCVFMCELEDTSKCDSLCGDVMDHRAQNKAVRVNNSAVITLTTTTTSDNLYHSGVYGKVIPYELSNPKFFECNQTVHLSNETFFLVSQNYPFTPTDFSSCFVHFVSSKKIRLAIYLISTYTTGDDPFNVYGQKGDGTWANISYSGKYVNDGDPFGLYFDREVIVSYKFGNMHASYQRSFYILVDEFDAASEYNSCNNVGTFELEYNQNYSISTFNYGTSSYLPFSDCSYSISNPFLNHLILILFQYESEKCCDTLDFDGIGPAPFSDGTLQGAQMKYWYFAHTAMTTMHFQTDGVMEGPGFSGTFYDIDCDCGEASITLSESFLSFNLSSPNLLLGAPTYCPLMNCSWLINFPSDYDAILTFPVLSLRSSYSTPDMLSINDTFGNLLKAETSGNLQPLSLVVTSGPYTVGFASSSADAFTDSQMAPGFLISMNLQKKNLITRTIQLTDVNMLEDISVEAFRKNPTSTYEYLIKARSNDRKITIYFFTTVWKRANIDIYDGSTPNVSLKVNPLFLMNITETGSPISFTSAGPILLIRIRSNFDYGSNHQDFQAMVTDLEEFEVMVFSTSTASISTQLGSSKPYTILHATDINYDRQLICSLAFVTNGDVRVFKGLSQDSKYLLSNSTYDPIPPIIFDRYLLINYDHKHEMIFHFEWTVLKSIAIPITISSESVGTIATVDYLPYQSVLEPAQQQISIELMDHESLGIHVEFLKSSNQGSGIIEIEKYGSLIGTEKYSGENGTFTFERCGTKFVIMYESPAGPENGLYLKYKAGTLDCTNNKSNRMEIIFTVLIVYIIMLIY